MAGEAGLVLRGRWPALVAVMAPLCLGAYISFSMTAVNAGAGETGLAAASLVRDGVIGNPYAVPTGPTAHVSPVHVGLLAVVYALFGVNSPAARAVLSLICLVTYLGCTAGVLWFCQTQRLGRMAQAVALFLTCLLPFQLFTGVISLRQWDQPFAAATLVASLLASFDPAVRDRPAYWLEARMAGLTGIAALVSPSAVPTLIYTSLYLLWVRRHLRPVRAGLLWLVIVGVCVIPWGLRNQAELGHFVLTRSNFPLELAVGNHDGATGRSSTDVKVHPHDSVAAAHRVAEVGEVAYMTELKAQVIEWIRAHPADFVRLTVTRIRLLIAPDGSIVGWDPLFGAAGVAGLTLAFAIVRLLAAALVLAFGQHRLLWLAHCVLPLAPYAVTHVSMRYEYSVLFTSICLICTAVHLGQERLVRRVRSPAAA